MVDLKLTEKAMGGRVQVKKYAKQFLERRHHSDIYATKEQLKDLELVMLVKHRFCGTLQEFLVPYVYTVLRV